MCTGIMTTRSRVVPSHLSSDLLSCIKTPWSKPYNQNPQGGGEVSLKHLMSQYLRWLHHWTKWSYWILNTSIPQYLNMDFTFNLSIFLSFSEERSRRSVPAPDFPCLFYSPMSISTIFHHEVLLNYLLGGPRRLHNSENLIFSRHQPMTFNNCISFVYCDTVMLTDVLMNQKP